MSPMPTRRSFLAATAGVAGITGVAGCLGDSGDAGGANARTRGSGAATETDATGAADGGSTGPATGSRVETTTDSSESYSTDTSVLPTRDDALPVEWSFARLRERTQNGGPPKDGIPSIDDPSFWSVAAADEFLEDDDAVFGVAGAEDVKAYPQPILVWHEIANDTIDGEPVTVSYCPLTGTAMGFLRGETTFGVSGRLVNSNLVMYDRETDSRWPQMLATAMSGPFERQSLDEFPVTWTTWRAWKEAYPETVVLSDETGYVRNYSRDPYGNYGPRLAYYDPENTNTLFPPLSQDDRYPKKAVVIGARPPEGAIAFRKVSLREQGVLTDEVGGATFHAVYDPALDTAHVYRGDGTDLTYEDGRLAVDGETVAPDALPLERVLDFDAMWFAWAGFYPGPAVVG